MSTLSWKDHLTHAAEFANLVPAVAAKVADPETKAVLLTTAKEINKHIAAGTRKVERELDVLIIDPVNGRLEFDDL